MFHEPPESLLDVRAGARRERADGAIEHCGLRDYTVGAAGLHLAGGGGALAPFERQPGEAFADAGCGFRVLESEFGFPVDRAAERDEIGQQALRVGEEGVILRLR